jgi:hypothetical protein
VSLIPRHWRRARKEGKFVPYSAHNPPSSLPLRRFRAARGCALTRCETWFAARCPLVLRRCRRKECAMIRKSVSLTVRVLVLVMLVSGSAVAGGGGRGGDSSMNPFTGDSYAYFHGGHNLGEEGMILPGRAPRSKVAPIVAGKAPPTALSKPTGTFRSPEARPAEPPTKPQN